MTTIHFHDVGRDKLSWSVNVQEPTESAILNAIKKRGALMSRAVWVEDGYIVAGDRVVGRYTVGSTQQSLTA